MASAALEAEFLRCAGGRRAAARDLPALSACAVGGPQWSGTGPNLLQDGAGVVGEASGGRVGWSVVLGEFVGAQVLLVYGDAETGAERDVEVAVAQGRRQVGRLRAGEQQVV